MAHAIDIAINLSILVLIIAWCFQILYPFISLIAWAGIIAIAIYPAYMKLARMLGDRHKTALVIIVLLAGGIILVPLWLFMSSLIDTAIDLTGKLEAGTLTVDPPAARVQDWPVIGEKVFDAWSDASANLSAFFAEHHDQVQNVAGRALAAIASGGIGVLQFFVSVIIAAVFLANTESATVGTRRLLTRVAGEGGADLQKLCVATIRSIAVGVLGIALIQALAAGLGIALVGLPAPGLWAMIVLVLAVVQLPPLLVLLPLAIYVFSIQSTTVAVLFLIWAIVVSLSDAVLKPMMLGRGVDAPMLVILLGAIGGMIMSGIIGLFVGAVVLGLSYKLFQIWLASGRSSEPVEEAANPRDD